MSRHTHVVGIHQNSIDETLGLYRTCYLPSNQLYLNGLSTVQKIGSKGIAI